MKIGLALSGGGARGIVHLGIIKALAELGIKPDMIAGTSAGAIAGAMLANGYSPDEILDIILKTNFFQYFRPTFGGMGLLKMDKAEELYLKYLPHNRFDQLKLPLIVAATDIQAGELVYFDSGELIKPIMASSCLPGIFQPITFQKRTLVDGAVLNNLPIEPLLGKVDVLVGINCNPFFSNKPVKSTRDVLEKSIMLAIRSKTQERLQQCQIKIESLEVGKFDVYDLRKAREIFKIGYNHVKKSKEISAQITQIFSI